MRQTTDQLSPREYEEYEQQKEMFQLNAEHVYRLKQLEVEALKVETRINSLFKLPLLVVKLPVLLLLGLGFIVGSFREDYEPGESFWNLLK